MWPRLALALALLAALAVPAPAGAPEVHEWGSGAPPAAVVAAAFLLGVTLGLLVRRR